MEADQVSSYSPLSTLWSSPDELDQSTEELQYQLVCATMDLETAKEVAKAQGGLHESRIQQLQYMLEAARKERDEAIQECKRLQEHLLDLSDTPNVPAKPPRCAVSLSNQMNTSYQHSTPSSMPYCLGLPGDPDPQVTQTSLLSPVTLNLEEIHTPTSDFCVNCLDDHKSFEDVANSLGDICGNFILDEETRFQPEKLHVNDLVLQPEERHHLNQDHTQVSAESSWRDPSSFPNVSASNLQTMTDLETTDPPPELCKGLPSSLIISLQSRTCVTESKKIAALSDEIPAMRTDQSQPSFSNNTTLPPIPAIKLINKTKGSPMLAMHSSPFLQSSFPSADHSIFSYTSALVPTCSTPATIPSMHSCGVDPHNAQLMPGTRLGGTFESIPTISCYSSSDNDKLSVIMSQQRFKADRIDERPPNKATPKRRHLPEPPEADIEVMLRSLPKKGKLLEAVMKAGPLLKHLFMMPPLPQWQIPPPKVKSMDIPRVPTSPNSVLMASPNHHTLNGGPLDFRSAFGNIL